MPIIKLEFEVAAPPKRVFDLSRSVELHVDSTSRSREVAIDGVTSGLLALDDEVTWEATHFGVRQRLTSRITAFDRPHHFRDSMLRGAFSRFDHDHRFELTSSGTLVRDEFDFDAPLGPLGKFANALFLTRYMRRFLEERLRVVKNAAESDDWNRYL